jgi:hypothetical protein
VTFLWYLSLLAFTILLEKVYNNTTSASVPGDSKDACAHTMAICVIRLCQRVPTWETSQASWRTALCGATTDDAVMGAVKLENQSF